MSVIDKYREEKENIYTSFIILPIEDREQTYIKLAKLLEFDRDNPDLPIEFVDGIMSATKEEEDLTHMDVFGTLYEKPWTIKDAASLLSVKSTTVRKYIKDGKLKASQPGRKYLIDYKDLKKFREQSQTVS
ncbi:MAG: helix-turn-helix domain-containing protein [Candidatus Marinimicrobia bacterium]|nr:helix-turn-helix domain-containing protein [Candidatus Neomarinimicrobiota bacterium]